jgi:hypothetical protein
VAGQGVAVKSVFGGVESVMKDVVRIRLPAR